MIISWKMINTCNFGGRGFFFVIVDMAGRHDNHFDCLFLVLIGKRGVDLTAVCQVDVEIVTFDPPADERQDRLIEMWGCLPSQDHGRGS